MKLSSLLTLALTTGSALATPFSLSKLNEVKLHEIFARQDAGGVTAGDLIPELEDLLEDIKEQTKNISKLCHHRQFKKHVTL
jgi:hypothetical protein